MSDVMLTWILRLEDPRHIWIKHEGSPVLMRLRLQDKLTVQQMKHLSLAECSRPVKADVDIQEWQDNAFLATLSEIHCPGRIEVVARRRMRRGKPMAK